MGRYGYKVLFITISDGSMGYWLRYSYTWSHTKSKRSVWLTIFGDRGPRGVCLEVDDIKFDVDKGYRVSGRDTYFSSIDEVAIYSGASFSWRLKIKGDPTFNTIPPLLRVFRRSRYVMVHPYALFNGYVVFRDTKYLIKNLPGMVGYTSSDRYLNHWIWGHCSSLGEGDGWVDILVASPDGREEVALGAVKYGDRVYRLSGLLGSTFEGEYGLGYFTGGIASRAGFIKFRFEVGKRDIIIASYEDPLRGYRYCHNTEVADADISFKPRGGDEVRIKCIHNAFMEYALPDIIDEELPRIMELRSI